MRIRFLGTGDAFGSGGRFNTCFLVEGREPAFLIDCGATSLVALRRFGVDPDALAGVVVSHLHGDHFGGLPFLILDAQYVSRRARPLVLAGPAGLEARLQALTEAMFPGAWGKERGFPLVFVELSPRTPARIEALGIEVTGYEVSHPSGAPSLALRIAREERVLAFTGDTEWVDALLEAGAGADLVIAECSRFDPPAPYHLDYRTLRRRWPEFGAKRLVLTHMSEAMLARLAEIDVEAAHDGLEITLG
jgi:ribonuclease BN (tRNA processing enzyme)